MRPRPVRLCAAVGVVASVLAGSVQRAHALPPFWQQFQAKYVDANSPDVAIQKFSQTALSAETGQCLVCHQPGKPKTERNVYGAALAELLDKDNFQQARLDAEPDAVKQEITKALDTVAARKADPQKPDSPTFAQLIAQGLLPGSPVPKATTAAPAAEPPPPATAPPGGKTAGESDQPAGTPSQTTQSAVAGGTNQLAAQLVAQIKSELRAELAAELEPQLREQLRTQLTAQLKAELKDQLKGTLKAIVLAELNAPGPVPSDVEAQALQQIGQLGGSTMQVAQNDDSKIVAFHLTGTALTDEGLVHLKSVNRLVELNLKSTQITDAGLAHLASITSLRRLNLAETQVSDAGLEYLMGLDNLVYLNLYGSQVTDAGLKHLLGMTNLRKLFLWQSHVTEAGAKQLQQELPNCEVNY